MLCRLGYSRTLPDAWNGAEVECRPQERRKGTIGMHRVPRRIADMWKAEAGRSRKEPGDREGPGAPQGKRKPDVVKTAGLREEGIPL